MILVQRSNQLSYRGQLLSCNRKFMYIWIICNNIQYILYPHFISRFQIVEELCRKNTESLCEVYPQILRLQCLGELEQARKIHETYFFYIFIFCMHLYIHGPPSGCTGPGVKPPQGLL